MGDPGGLLAAKLQAAFIWYAAADDDWYMAVQR
jgi:hypothetical protein